MRKILMAIIALVFSASLAFSADAPTTTPTATPTTQKTAPGTKKQGQIKTLANSSWLDYIQNTLQNIISPIFQTIFKSIQNVVHSQAFYTIIALAVCFWLINMLKTGYPTRAELFRAGQWLLLVILVLAVYSSYDAYTGFLSLFMFPANLVKEGVSQVFNNATTSGSSFGNLITDAINSLADLRNVLWQVAMKNISPSEWNPFSWIVPDNLLYFIAFFTLFFFWIFYICAWLVIIAVCAVVIFSTFAAMIILSVAPIMIPFLMFSRTRPYFYSWLKVFISYSLYAPIAFIVLAIALSPISQFKTIKQTNAAEAMWLNQEQYFFAETILCVIALFLLMKIPNWISQVMGVQGLESGGTRIGAGVASFAGSVTGNVAGGAIKGAIASKAKGEGIRAGLNQGVKDGFIKGIPGGQSAMETFKNARAVKDGRAMKNAQSASDGRGNTATP